MSNMKTKKELAEIEQLLATAISTLTYPEKVVWAICGALWAIRITLEKPVAEGDINLSGISEVMKRVKESHDRSRN